MNPPKQLDLKNSTDASKTWQQFKQSWQIYEIASATIEKSPVVRLATFLHVAGPDAVKKYNGFTFESEEEKSNLDIVLQKFDKDCKQTTNILAERKKFYSRVQLKNETIDNYVTELRVLSSTCNFCNVDDALRDHFAFHIKSKRGQERILAEAQCDYKNLSFDKAVSIAKLHEVIEMETNQEDEFRMEVDKIQNQIRTEHRKYIENCKYCGKGHVAKKCPAYGKTCSSCGKVGHFQSVCLKKKHNNFQICDYNTDKEYVSDNESEEMI